MAREANTGIGIFASSLDSKASAQFQNDCFSGSSEILKLSLGSSHKTQSLELLFFFFQKQMYFLLSLQQAGMNKFRWLCACPQWTAFASDWMTTRQFAVCLSGDWTPSCCSCWPSTPQEGVHGGERHSVAQGTWRNRSWCCSSVSQSCPTLCDPLDCSTPGFPVHH